MDGPGPDKGGEVKQMHVFGEGCCYVQSSCRGSGSTTPRFGKLQNGFREWFCDSSHLSHIQGTGASKAAPSIVGVGLAVHVSHGQFSSHAPMCTDCVVVSFGRNCRNLGPENHPPLLNHPQLFDVIQRL